MAASKTDTAFLIPTGHLTNITEKISKRVKKSLPFRKKVSAIVSSSKQEQCRFGDTIHNVCHTVSGLNYRVVVHIALA